MLKRFATLLTLLTALTFVGLFGCDDTPESIVLDQILREALPYESPYTGGLIQIGTLKNFGSNITSPTALEWNGEHLYMLADRGKYQYLFTVDKHTGKALIVNTGARNLGGSFGQGRNFTQVGYTEPTDMTWHKTTMLAICPVLDSIVSINLQTGLAGRISFRDDFCLRYPKGDTDFDKEFGGYRVIGSSIALAHTPQGFFMWGVTQRNNKLTERGWGSFGQFYKVSENLTCATPIGEPILQSSEDESHAYSLEYDGQHLYMSGLSTKALHILNQETGESYLIAKWHFTQMPKGIQKLSNGYYLDTDNPKYPEGISSIIQVTGITFDGTDMYAIESFTNALYKLERN